MKNQNKTRSLLSIGAIGLGAVMAIGAIAPVAQAAPYDINHREHRQHKRIVNGAHSGQLTRAERARLHQREVHIKRVESRDRRSGGRFTPAERRQVQRDLNKTNRAIYNQKHDRQHR